MTVNPHPPPLDYGPLADRLLPQHLRLITNSGITPEVVEARGYRSITKKAELARLDFKSSQLHVPTLLIPIHGVAGEVITHQHRPDLPRINNRKPIKYETPAGSTMAVDVPPSIRHQIGDPAVPLFITEGARKADAAVSKGLCCVDLLGVWNWRGSNELGGITALADWESIALKAKDGTHRRVYVCFDSDVMTKREVWDALKRLKGFLESRGASVHLVYLPPLDAGQKQGLDDFIAAGHGVADLLELASETLRPPPTSSDDAVQGHPYRTGPDGLFMVDDRDEERAKRLTNFQARIIANVIEDDGTEVRRAVEIESSLKDRSLRLTVPVAEFARMDWPMVHLGSEAVVFPRRQEHARVAIQLTSGDPVERYIRVSTGWFREPVGGWAYAHAGGAIGPDGLANAVQVRLPAALSRFVLPEPPASDELVRAVRASLQVPAIVGDQLGLPLYMFIWRSVLGLGDMSAHLAGRTGVGKTEFAALHQQHFGAGLDARHLPMSWTSTANAMEALAFHAKDALLTVDDYCPVGTPSDVQRLNATADRLFRGAGNGAGRGRMRADTTIRPPKPPRGLILSTGEDIPRGHSLLARLLVLEVGPGTLDWTKLSAGQVDAADGLYAAAMAGFLKWLAPRYDVVAASVRSEVAELRQRASKSSLHRRTPEIVANLAVGWRYFLRFAHQVGAMTQEEVVQLWEHGWLALGQAADAQTQHQAATEPAARYLELLDAAFAAGRAYVTDATGNQPDKPDAWGWMRDGDAWRPRGRRIGWLTMEGLLLQPDAAFAVVRDLGNATNEPVAVGSKTMTKRLFERGALVTSERERGKYTVRKVLGGKRLNVLHLAKEVLPAPESAQPAQSAQREETWPIPSWSPIEDGADSGADLTDRANGSAHPISPEAHDIQEKTDLIGPIGPNGPISAGDIPTESQANASRCRADDEPRRRVTV